MRYLDLSKPLDDALNALIKEGDESEVAKAAAALKQELKIFCRVFFDHHSLDASCFKEECKRIVNGYEESFKEHRDLFESIRKTFMDVVNFFATKISSKYKQDTFFKIPDTETSKTLKNFIANLDELDTSKKPQN